MIVYFVLIACGILIAFCFYMLFRNRVVFNYRNRVLDRDDLPIGESLIQYRQLPEYREMMWQIFRFDWSDYLTDNKKESIK